MTSMNIATDAKKGPMPGLLALICVALLATGCSRFSGASSGNADQSAMSVAAALEDRLDSLSNAALDTVYGRSPRPIWVDDDGITSVGQSALDLLEETASEGLDPARYVLDGVRPESSEDAGPRELARLDTELTSALALLSRDLARGVVASTEFDPRWRVDSLDATALPSRPESGEAILDHLERVRPRVQQYERLQTLLARLREVRAAGGWPTVGGVDDVVEEGDSARIVVQLRARLAESLSEAERHLAESGDQPPRLDTELAQAVAYFQARHDVMEDGLVGPQTIDALNVPVEDRIRDVVLALERWRWLPADLGSPAVLVNTAGRRVHVLEEGAPVLSMKAIVGQRDWKTVLFQDEMERIVVNPYWNVPDNIFAEEILPKAREDDEYLSTGGFEVFDPESGEIVPPSEVDWDDVEPESFPYRIRQTPGEKNALGLVKFLFPNRFAIYLHDTPAEHRFDDRLRTFSHGCVRVERPAELARYLLGEASSHDPARFAALRATGERQILELDPHVPTYVVYQTVWLNDDGVPTFTPDVYDRDADVVRALSSEMETFAEERP